MDRRGGSSRAMFVKIVSIASSSLRTKNATNDDSVAEMVLMIQVTTRDNRMNKNT